MLKLKKLQILGFKSFCDRTELKFHGDGIAAIVGPNGCGKSNISDAISWVLGEQSAKTLRGSRMEDVIFIGTRERKPTGMAEVSLTLIDPEVYEGGPALLSTETEIEIQDGGLDDWDEAALRDSAAADTEQAIAEVQPLSPEELEVEGTTEAGVANAPGAGETEAGDAGKHVVLKIRRRKLRPASVKAGEIVITRRLFRSGESEYLLNGKICRLRDIQDLFMGTGLGPESYAIIEQGRIGQILSSKPHDRRAIIEEAAGVTKFKTKKRLSEARLEQSKLNLARINDIFDEVTRQMNSLKRQAAKAERYARLREELRAKLRVVLASRFAQMARDSESLKGDLARIAGEIESRTESVQQRESEQATNHQRGYALQEEARQNAERLTSIALEADRASGRRQHNEERCAELAARSAAAQAEMGRTGEQLAKIEGELATNRAILESAAADAAAASQESALRQHEAQTAVAALANAEQMQEQRRGEIMETVAAASAVRNELAKAEEHAAALKRESDRIGQEITAGRQQLENFGGQRGQAAFEFESVSQAVAQLTQQVAGTRASLENKRAAESEAKLQLDGLRAEYASALGKKSSLEAIIAQHGYSTESVKRLFQSGAVQKGFAPAGVLADFLEVEDRYENVVEDFLRDELNYVVVKSWDAADEGLRLLRSNVDGRATFLVHPEDAQARFSFIFDEKSRPAPRRDSVVPLKNCIRVLNGFGKSLEVILPKLGNGYITQDANTARDMALENPNAFFLTPGGETFHNVTVTGGKKSSEGPLSMKRELRDALRSLSELEAALREQEARVGLLGREIAQLSSRLSRLEEEKREAESRALTSGHALQQLESELGRIQQRMTTYDAEFSRISEEAQQTAQTLAEKQHEHARHEAQHREIEAEFQTTQSQLAGLRVARDAAGQSASLAASRSAALQERQTAAGSALQRIETLCTETQMRLASLEAQIEAAAAEQRQRQSENTTLAEQLSTLQTEQETGKQRAAELQASAEQLRAQGQLIEQQLRELRTELDRARDQRGEVSAALAKLQSDVEHLAESCRNDLNIGKEELMADPNLALLEGEALALEDAAQHEMRTRLENMGPVNMMALEEYNEVAQRHSFLETQRKDLQESIENTQATIKELDELTRQKFEEAFNHINENFQMTFRKLFGGGQAFMRLTDLENSSESGIDVIASPPGKKLQNVLLLSGGEKALTALALLVGIFQYQPSPFCVLDEVDAPLDEANVGRFTEMVKEMSLQTQFVIITHNKRTMGVAPVMYGVTMQEPGVSKIVSVRFGEVQAASA